MERPGGLVTFGVACREAVHKKEASVFDHLEGFQHLFRRGSETRTHVVVHSCGKGDRGDVRFHGVRDLGGFVSDVKRTRARAEAPIAGLHGLVKHDFMAFSVDPGSRFLGCGEPGQNGEGHWNAKVQERFCMGKACTNIINN